MKTYEVSIPLGVDADLDWVARNLGVTKGEALRRALVLMKAAVEAESVQVNFKGGMSSLVKIRD